MSAWTYERIITAKAAWNEARRLLPPKKPDDPTANTPKPHPIREDGTGPQFA